jgi:hypothetical protein
LHRGASLQGSGRTAMIAAMTATNCISLPPARRALNA